MWRWKRRADGLVEQAIEPVGGGGSMPIYEELVTSFGYDSKLNLNSTTYADGSAESWTYDPDFGVLADYVDPLGTHTHYVLDSHCNAEQQQENSTGAANPDSSVTQRTTKFVFTAAPTAIDALPGGLVTDVTVAFDTDDAVTTHTDYFTSGTKVGLVQKVTSAYGTDQAVNVEYDYDGRRNRNVVQNERGKVTIYDHDALNRLVLMTEPSPGVVDGDDPDDQDRHPQTKYVYDKMGNQIQLYTPRSMELNPDDRYYTETQYDAMNRVEYVIEPPAGEGAADTDTSAQFWTHNIYDANGNLDTTADSLLRISAFYHDRRNQLITEALPAPNVTADSGLDDDVDAAPVTNFRYDMLGNVAASSDPRNTNLLTWFAYDSRNRQTRTLPPADGDSQPLTVNHYDALGRLDETQTLTSSGFAVSTSTFDRLGRVVKVQAPADYLGRRATTVNQYDLRDNLEQTTTEGQATTTEYDLLGRPKTITGPDPGHGMRRLVTTNTYTTTGRLESTKSQDQGDPLAFTFTSYLYDNLDRLKVVTGADPDGSGPRPPSVTKSKYDADGNVVQTSGFGWITETSGGVPTPIEVRNDTDFQFDQLGRMWQQLDPTVSLLSPYVSPNSGRLKTEYSFDQAGRTIRIDVTNRVADQSATTQSTELTQTTQTTRLAYDDLDRLYQTTEWADQTGTSSNNRVSRTFYDALGDERYIVDPLGNVTQQTFDNLGRLHQVVLPATSQHAASITEYGYNAASVLTSEKEAVGTALAEGIDTEGGLALQVLETVLPAVNGISAHLFS